MLSLWARFVMLMLIIVFKPLSNNRITIECRWHTDVLKNDKFLCWNASYQSITVILTVILERSTPLLCIQVRRLHNSLPVLPARTLTSNSIKAKQDWDLTTKKSLYKCYNTLPSPSTCSHCSIRSRQLTPPFCSRNKMATASEDSGNRSERPYACSYA